VELVAVEAGLAARAAAAPNSSTIRSMSSGASMSTCLAPARARHLEEVDDLRDDSASPASCTRRASSRKPGTNASSLMRSMARLHLVHGHRLDHDQPGAAAGVAPRARDRLVGDDPSSRHRCVTIAGP
jgi:hypothetical protein